MPDGDQHHSHTPAAARDEAGPGLVTDELVQLEIGPVAHGGHCVARYDGRVVFVRHTLPGEVVLARLTESAPDAKFWRADAVEAIEPSPDRVPAPCPVAGPGLCGGCDWQHADLSAQRRLKADVVTEQLRRIAKLDPVPEVVVEGPDGDGLGWRTRVRFTVDTEGRPGLRKHRSHDVVAVKECLIATPDAAELGVTQARWPGALAVEVISPSTGGPLVVAEPVAGRTGDKLRLPKLPQGTNLATRDESGVHQVKGRTWVSEEVVVAGSPRPFRVTGTGFWQVHPAAAQTLHDAVMEAAQARPGERALDLYGGVGLFAAGLAEQVGVTGTVVLVEGDSRAASDARRGLHDLDQVRVEAGSVSRVLPRLATEGQPLAEGGADVIVLDPPRSGAGKDVIAQMVALAPRVIVYVACDPAALARDLATADAAGYALSGLRAFDLFPMTHHVECVAVLEPRDGRPEPREVPVVTERAPRQNRPNQARPSQSRPARPARRRN
ncbi:class I SAM-dependent RNA methyltransferase [Kineosporia succinea]|uniref:tRNA/tmRNA/rRNA uracil-C5-methylase (TrmA/RlmC/RlmD family) n=1 Tax=Kineosporia succinea TaxID=84632 RepID=A0ABT9NW78_9ACTN|nr:class I SAM-dependent RNA methyltransferase [Kineosporia succinea]MDP9824522.1 tRNA/tmRNA/rRNA uracil-C5-methylase (TrmA/RlmC/RlmD family) [Kineosporia succinea]